MGQLGDIFRCDMVIVEIGAILRACVIVVLNAISELDELAIEYVIGLLSATCELSATDELFAVVPTIVGLTGVEVGFGACVLVSGYGVAGGGKGVGGSSVGNGGLHVICPLERDPVLGGGFRVRHSLSRCLNGGNQ